MSQGPVESSGFCTGKDEFYVLTSPLVQLISLLLTLSIHSVIPLSLFMSYFERDCDMIMVGLLRQKSCYFYHYDCVILTPGASRR